MGVLKRKIKASTLMETIVATSIIIIVFVVSSLILNNTFKNVVYNDTYGVQNRMEELQYFYNNKQIQLPYEEEYKEYTITLEKESRAQISYLVVEGTHKKTTKVITIESINEQQ